ncbi:MAG: LacI family DNA-binding transcriptional regulator [Kiritimatiellae bacterium]|nr:LacI family DNA-binding transcriptional regulator [Kiritimatiellia bacterium]
MKRSGKITLRDIADRLGLSRMTVSLALRGDGRISDGTREKVKETALAMGYQPDPKIGELMAETARSRYEARGEVIAVMTSEPTRNGWRKFDPDNTFQVIAAHAAEYGYKTEAWWLADPDMPPEKVNNILWSRGIRGLIIPNISHACFMKFNGTLPIEWQRFSVVDIGGGLRQPDMYCVRHNHMNGMFTALDNLEALGYRRIGLCLRSEDDLRAGHRWSAAYSVWRQLRGHVTKLMPLIEYEPTKQSVCRWIRKNRIEAVVGLRYLPIEEWGWRVPDDIGYAALHLWGDEVTGFSGIDQMNAQIAASAVDMLVMVLRKRHTGQPDHPMKWIFKGRWVHGSTTRQVRPAVKGRPGIENEWLTIK